MDIVALFFTLAILVLVAMYLYAPLMRGYTRLIREEEHELSALMAERDRVINSLQELDFDFKLGKIPSDEYPMQRAHLLQKGADILQKIDELTSEEKLGTHRGETKVAKTSSHRKAKRHSSDHSPVLSSGARVSVQNAEERIERAVAACRMDTSVTKPELADDDIEVMISARRRNHQERSAGFCPKCGKPVMASDRFCPACGKALT